MADNSKVQTLDEYIRYGKTSSYSVPASAYIRRVNNIVMHDKFAYEKYHLLLKAMSRYAVLTDEELNVYKYKPDLISYKLYGTPNLAHLLCYLNNCAEYEFNKKRIRFITLDDLHEIFNLIMSHESETMNKLNKIEVR